MLLGQVAAALRCLAMALEQLHGGCEALELQVAAPPAAVMVPNVESFNTLLAVVGLKKLSEPDPLVESFNTLLSHRRLRFGS